MRKITLASYSTVVLIVVVIYSCEGQRVNLQQFRSQQENDEYAALYRDIFSSSFGASFPPPPRRPPPPQFFVHKRQPTAIFRPDHQLRFQRNIHRPFVRNQPTSFTTVHRPRAQLSRPSDFTKFQQVQQFVPYVGPPKMKHRGGEVQAPAGFMLTFNLLDESSGVTDRNNYQNRLHQVPTSDRGSSYAVPQVNAGVLPLEGEVAKWRISYEFPPYRK